MAFKLCRGTAVICENDSMPVNNAVSILRRDIEKRFYATDNEKNEIRLTKASGLESEDFIIIVSEDNITVSAGDELGFVYGLLYISEKFIGIQPFWFWMDSRIEKIDFSEIECGQYRAAKPIIKYRGWFVNDEVLLMKWSIDGDRIEPWKMVFEALLRCGGNTVIAGTDKNLAPCSRIASEMGLWITHHHAAPLGAEMFVRAYPNEKPNYAENPELFHRLWEDGVKSQRDMKVIWTLGFRGQGDCPFWSSDSSGLFNTPEKRGRLISDIIGKQSELVRKYVKNPILATNLYGEVTELYEKGYISLDDDIIKISADNGYGKMVSRRRGIESGRVSSMPTHPINHGGIYYHVSFYDLQAANHITIFPGSVDFVNRELDGVLEMNMTDCWIINCSNVRPHVYFLDAIREKWFGRSISDEEHSREFADAYFGGSEEIARAYSDYHDAMIRYGDEEDELAGEQFYTENVRVLTHAIINGNEGGVSELKWLTGDCRTGEQVERFTGLCRDNLDNISRFYSRCLRVSASLCGNAKTLFDATLLMQTAIHYYCTRGVVAFGDGYREYERGEMKNAFVRFGDSAEEFRAAEKAMRGSEYGVWRNFYQNDCFADIKHTSYMAEKLMGYVRERGDNSHHDKWYRDVVYSPEDRYVYTLLVTDNHMTDDELYRAFKAKDSGR